MGGKLSAPPLDLPLKHMFPSFVRKCRNNMAESKPTTDLYIIWFCKFLMLPSIFHLFCFTFFLGFNFKLKDPELIHVIIMATLDTTNAITDILVTSVLVY